MSDDRRRKRLERFRGGLITRARAMTARLLVRMQGGGAAGDEQDVARELHTLKGDARMLGLTDIAEVAHAAESLLIVTGAARVDGERIVQALDAVVATLEGRLGDESVAARELQARVRALQASSAAVVDGPAPVEEAPAAAGPAIRWVQVDGVPLDEVCDGLNEFAFEMRQLHHHARTEAKQAPRAGRRAALERLERLDRLGARLDELVERSWTLRLSPLEPLLQDLARHARELAQEQGKRMRTSVRCAGVQLERVIVDALWDPLLHLVRNAVDHGIETPAARGTKPAEAMFVISAEPIGPNVLVEVYDDGRGVDTAQVRAAAIARKLVTPEDAFALDERAALDLIFQHGFSTRSVATELSGRGVGLDVVRTVVERLGGSVRVVSDLGQGTRFLLDIPSRIGKERNLLFACADGVLALPSRSVREIVRRPVGATSLTNGADELPVLEMETVLTGQTAKPGRFVLIVEVQNRRWALAVSDLVGEQELVRRPVDALLGGSGLAGAAATLADGRLVLILSPSELVRRSGLDGVLPTPVLELEEGK